MTTNKTILTATLAIALTAILVTVFGGIATAQTPSDPNQEIKEAPTATPTPTLVPKMEEEQEYSAHCHGRETGDDNSCEGHDTRRPITPTPTSTPKPTATPRPTATPKPKSPSSNNNDGNGGAGNGNSGSGGSGGSGNRGSNSGNGTVPPTDPPPKPANFEATAGNKLTLSGKNLLTLSWNSRRGVDYY